MGDNLEKQLLNEILKREKELHALKQAYGVLSGSEILAIGGMAIELPSIMPGQIEQKGISKVVKKPIRVTKKARLGTPEFRKAISKAMKKSWKRRKAGIPKKVEKPVYPPKGVGKWAGLTKKQRSAEISKRMRNYWAKRRKEKLGQRGLPTRVETHHKPVEFTPVIHTPVPVVPPGREKGRLAFLPVGRVRKNRVWTEQEDEVLMALWKNNTPAEIASRLLRTVKNVEKRYVRLKEDAVIRKTLRMPKSERGAKFMDSYRKSWDNGLVKTKQRWSPEEDAKLVKLARSGWSSKQISKELKRSVGSVVVRYMIKTGDSVIPADRKRRKRGERSSLSKRKMLRG